MLAVPDERRALGAVHTLSVHAAFGEALERLRGYGPEFGPRLSNHGPMAADALIAMGRADAVVGFVERYARTLEPAPEGGSTLGEDWSESLGRIDRWPEWVAWFEHELAVDPPADVVATWLPRLAPGASAAATHGLIRTAHALRALLADTPGGPSPSSQASLTPEGRRELAEALGYWAARYQELPGPPILIGQGSIGETLERLPELPEEAPEEFLISDQLRHLDMIAKPFEQAVSSLAPPRELLAALDALALGGASGYLANADQGHAIAFVHTVTAPLALELCLPSLRAEDRPTVFAYLWQAVAGLHSAYGVVRSPRELPLELPDTAGLVDAAVASNDEHAIKLTEACLRSYRRTGEPMLLAAAADATVRLAH